MDSSVRFELRASILLISLDSPDQFPRLTRTVLRELLARFESIPAESNVRAVVITGTAQSFAAGADLEEVSALSPVEALRFSALGQSLMRAIESCPKPVIAAVRGYCLGGGLDLALACYLRIAGDDARFGHPGGSLGIITGWGGTARLPRIVGAARARELLTTGKFIDAAEAYAWRLVNRVVPPADALATAMEWAQEIPR
ncbi:MAG: enoyl-CoA hydratase/isomerase family protein [Acidobacteria bacterium]|nr:enoyl-CoA hydratase/isomerase family protein [Acidobacteriota bacterium]MCL5288003.1 enoyl-CoA hydratase/isomerase family protein [Acidobacteriota bacterium]